MKIDLDSRELKYELQTKDKNCCVVSYLILGSWEDILFLSVYKSKSHI